MTKCWEFKLKVEKKTIKTFVYSDDGKDIVGYYVNTDNYQLQYSKDGNFLRMEALRGLEKVA